MGLFVRYAMHAMVGSVLRDETAQDLAEYAIALAVIAIGVVLAVNVIGSDVQALWSQAQTTISSVASAV